MPENSFPSGDEDADAGTIDPSLDHASSPAVDPRMLWLAVSKQSDRALSTDVLSVDAEPSGGLLSRLRRWLSPRTSARTALPGNSWAAMPISELSVASLRTELRVVDREIAGILGQLSILQISERKALEHRDKLALDVAWAGREAQNARLQQLEGHRDSVYQALAARFEPQVSGWQERANAAVERWRREDHDRLGLLRERTQQIRELVGDITKSRHQRSDEYRQFREELEALREAADPVSIPTPDVDWTQPALDFGPLGKEIEQARRALLRADQGGSLLAASEVDAESSLG